VIDLHLHTTASDGRLTPTGLVAHAAAAGIRILAVTDHDTTDGFDEAAAEASRRGVLLIPGIEITAVERGRDVHMLGYFFDPASARLAGLLEQQRALRVARVREIGAKLASVGLVVDVESVLMSAAARPGSSVGRPQLARELVRAGYVTSVQEAFDKWLASGRPAFIERTGPSPAAIVDVIHQVGGIASMAHPGVTKRDELIGPLADRGMDAIEVYHSDHSPEQQQQYQAIAHRYGMLVSGGSDFHGDDPDGAAVRAARAPRARRGVLGVISLPAPAFAALEQKASIYR
jgi:predicted metal-dependent phosphoesterase TrpH